MNQTLNTHSKTIGYLLWILGFTGAHRFYFGKPMTGALWFFTGGLLGIGWIVDFFLIPGMDKEADFKYWWPNSKYNYNLTWVLLVFFGYLGLHRFYLRKFWTGLLWLCTGGFFLMGYLYDLATLNEQIFKENQVVK